MKQFLLFVLFAVLFETIFSGRRHNTNDEYTKILDKIEPNTDLCNEDNCPLDRGTCSGENFCFCFDGFISTYETPTLCDYVQKDRTLYFILEFVLSLGIGHFYVGNYIYGIIKLICYLGIYGLYFGAYLNKKGIDAARIRLFLWVIISIWQFVDGLCIFRGIYTDGNDMPTGFKYI